MRAAVIALDFTLGNRNLLTAPLESILGMIGVIGSLAPSVLSPPSPSPSTFPSLPNTVHG